MAVPPPGPLLSVRAVLMLLIPVVAGLAAGILGYLACGGIASAALIGGDAIVGVFTLVHTLFDRR